MSWLRMRIALRNRRARDGDASQIADAQGGRGGVGISSPFPCLDGEQLGSVAGLQVMQLPVKVSLLG